MQEKTSKHHLPAHRGREAELFVKTNLWRRNFRVKDVGRVAHYDLLVNDKYRVEVKSMDKTLSTVQLDQKQFDVFVVVVVFERFGGAVAFYLRDKTMLTEMSKGGGVYGVDADALRRFFTRKPGEVFK